MRANRVQQQCCGICLFTPVCFLSGGYIVDPFLIASIEGALRSMVVHPPRPALFGKNGILC